MTKRQMKVAEWAFGASGILAALFSIPSYAVKARYVSSDSWVPLLLFFVCLVMAFLFFMCAAYFDPAQDAFCCHCGHRLSRSNNHAECYKKASLVKCLEADGFTLAETPKEKYPIHAEHKRRSWNVRHLEVEGFTLERRG